MRFLEKLFEVMGVLLMAMICILVFTGVVFRYVLRSPLGWIEEIARYSLVWVTYIGTFLALRRGRHLSINMVVKLCSPWVRKIIAIFARVVMMPFCFVMIFHGAYYASVFMNQGTPYLGIPFGYIYLVLPIIGVLNVVELSIQLIGVVKKEV